MAASNSKPFDLDIDVNFEVEQDPPQTNEKPAAEVTAPAESQQNGKKTEDAASINTQEDLKAKMKAAMASANSYQPAPSLTASGALEFLAEQTLYEASEADLAQMDEYYEEEDEDRSRDLCSYPCLKCGATPSFALYELCANCLDEVEH